MTSFCCQIYSPPHTCSRMSPARRERPKRDTIRQDPEIRGRGMPSSSTWEEPNNITLPVNVHADAEAGDGLCRRHKLMRHKPDVTLRRAVRRTEGIRASCILYMSKGCFLILQILSKSFGVKFSLSNPGVTDQFTLRGGNIYFNRVNSFTLTDKKWKVHSYF